MEDNQEAGIFLNSDATIEATHVRGTTPSSLEEYGDGIVAVTNEEFGLKFGAPPISVTITDARIKATLVPASPTSAEMSSSLAPNRLVTHSTWMARIPPVTPGPSRVATTINVVALNQPAPAAPKALGLSAPTPIVDTADPLPPP